MICVLSVAHTLLWCELCHPCCYRTSEGSQGVVSPRWWHRCPSGLSLQSPPGATVTKQYTPGGLAIKAFYSHGRPHSTSTSTHYSTTATNTTTTTTTLSPGLYAMLSITGEPGMTKRRRFRCFGTFRRPPSHATNVLSRGWGG